jgi:hypothetical protein
MKYKSEDKLLIITRIKKTIIYLDGVIDNFPIKEIILRDKLKGTIFDLLEIAYLANGSDKDIRVSYQKQLLVKIKMLDFYIKISCDKKIINYKRYEKVGKHLLEITKLVHAWINSEEDKNNNEKGK